MQFQNALNSEEKLVFGEKFSKDLLFLDGKTILKILDTDTYFSVATFLDAHDAKHGQSVQGIWFSFSMTWCTQ